MKSRLLPQMVLLFVPPFLAFAAVAALSEDYYLAISVSYLVLLVVLQFVALERFLLFYDLQELWKAQSDSDMQLLLEPAQFQPPIVKVCPKVILGDANLCNVAKLRYLLVETGSFIPGMRDEFRKNLFLNILILAVLMIITYSGNVVATHSGATNPQAGVQAGAAANNAGATSNAGHANGAADEGALGDFIKSQGRLVMSFFAVAIQLVWLGRVLFHYRQKNADLYFQSKATQVAGSGAA
jgi:hypothetical protein